MILKILIYKLSSKSIHKYIFAHLNSLLHFENTQGVKISQSDKINFFRIKLRFGEKDFEIILVFEELKRQSIYRGYISISSYFIFIVVKI